MIHSINSLPNSLQSVEVRKGGRGRRGDLATKGLFFATHRERHFVVSFNRA